MYVADLCVLCILLFSLIHSYLWLYYYNMCRYFWSYTTSRCYIQGGPKT